MRTAASLAPAVRLLDRIAQTRSPLLVARGGEVVRLPGPFDFAAAISACPLRLVLTDPLTRLCASLAYADGDRLGSCLDLVHIPAQRLWVEWLDAPRLEIVYEALGTPAVAADATAARAGVYLEAEPCGRRGTVRTFWGPADGEGEASLAPLVTEFDLDALAAAPGSLVGVFEGAAAGLDADDPSLASVLRCLRFRFDDAWAAYYRAKSPSPTTRAAVLQASLASVGTDLPVLFALCLLMSSRLPLPQRRPDLGRLNRRRASAGRAVLLDHVEVTAPVMSSYRVEAAGPGEWRRAPRLHHVRGHLVRRGQQIFWRVPHLRGRAAFGHLRARNVTLHFESRNPAARTGRPAEPRTAAGHRESVALVPGGPP